MKIKLPKNINQIALIAAIVIIAVIVIVRLIFKGEDEPSDRGSSIPYIPSEPKPGKNFNATNQSKIIRQKIMNFWIGNAKSANEAFEMILNYTNNELIAVANGYRDIYRKERYNTLRELLISEVAISDLKTQAIARLDELQIA